MKDKKQDVKSLMEFKKAVVEFGNMINGFIEGLSKLLNDMEIPDEEENKWEMKYPYEEGEKYWALYDDGTVNLEAWLEYGNECNTFNQGNAFPTKEAAELESKRRNLLTRFKAFRDECNGDWELDWNDVYQDKHIIKRDKEGNFLIVKYWTVNEFNLFGYFKDYKDAKRAIELFGDEIIELFVKGDA